MDDALSFYVGFLLGMLFLCITFCIIGLVKEHKEKQERYKQLYVNYGARLDSMEERVNALFNRNYEHGKTIKDTRSDISNIYVRLRDLEDKIP